MSVFQSSATFVERSMAKVAPDARRHERLRIDLRDLLIGPTCGGEAERLVDLIMTATLDKDIIAHLEATVTRFRGRGKGKHP